MEEQIENKENRMSGSKKRFVLDLDLPSWEEYVKEKHLPKFRAGQIYSWYSKGVLDMDRMTNVPGNIKTMLKEDFVCEKYEYRQTSGIRDRRNAEVRVRAV